MRKIKNKIKSLACNHNYRYFAYYYNMGIEVHRCDKCNKRKEIKRCRGSFV